MNLPKVQIPNPPEIANANPFLMMSFLFYFIKSLNFIFNKLNLWKIIRMFINIIFWFNLIFNILKDV